MGDKFASRNGQKGTIGIVLNKEDLPYTEDGIVPDILLDPGGYPKRMTIPQFIEILFGNLACELGLFGCYNAFETVNMEQINDILETKLGLTSMGNRILYNGMTGQQMEVTMFSGVMYYERSKLMVVDKINVRLSGKRDKNGVVVPGGAYTVKERQSVSGRSNGGGSKIGEMERDAIVAHGIWSFIKESFIERSDKFIMQVSKVSGEISICNPETNLFYDNVEDGIVSYNLNEELSKTNITADKLIGLNMYKQKTMDYIQLIVPYSFKLLVQELQGMCINIRLNVDMLNDIKEAYENGDGGGDDGDGGDGYDDYGNIIELNEEQIDDILNVKSGEMDDDLENSKHKENDDEDEEDEDGKENSENEDDDEEQEDSQNNNMNGGGIFNNNDSDDNNDNDNDNDDVDNDNDDVDSNNDDGDVDGSKNNGGDINNYNSNTQQFGGNQNMHSNMNNRPNLNPNLFNQSQNTQSQNIQSQNTQPYYQNHQGQQHQTGGMEVRMDIPPNQQNNISQYGGDIKQDFNMKEQDDLKDIEDMNYKLLGLEPNIMKNTSLSQLNTKQIGGTYSLQNNQNNQNNNMNNNMQSSNMNMNMNNNSGGNNMQSGGNNMQSGGNNMQSSNMNSNSNMGNMNKTIQIGGNNLSNSTNPNRVSFDSNIKIIDLDTQLNDGYLYNTSKNLDPFAKT